MAACAGYLESSLHIFLSFHFGKIEVEIARSHGKFLPGVNHRRPGSRGARQHVGHLAEVVHAVYLEIVDHGSFCGVCRGYEHALEPGSTGCDGHRQNATDGLQASVERQFAHYHVFVKFGSVYHP